MSFIKIASADDWDLLRDRPPIEVKLSSRGLLWGDRCKIAAEVGDEFIAMVRKIEDSLDPINNKYAHVIACGSTESTGPNRNADGWGKEALKRDMHTYLKHAKCYRDHHNDKDSLYYGRPKVAMYDEQRGYGRLLGEYYATDKTAGEKQSRIANLEIDCLERGDDFKVSLGSRIKSDTCSICGNEATKRADYCDSVQYGGKCPLFGCKTGLSKIAEDGRMQFVHNDTGNVFYDMSSIGLTKGASARQADRIAYATSYPINVKTATEHGGHIGSAAIAERMGLSMRDDLAYLTSGLSGYQQRVYGLGIKIASCDPVGDALLESTEHRDKFSGLVSDRPEVRFESAYQHALLGQVPGPGMYAKLAGANDATAELVRQTVPGLISKLAKQSQLEDLISRSVWLQHPLRAGYHSTKVASVADADISSEAVTRRRCKIAIAQNLGTTTTGDPDSMQAAKLSLDYVALKLAMSPILASRQVGLRFLA